MKFNPTASQTVGPFFSIGLESLCQKQDAVNRAPGTTTLHGTVVDGDGLPIPDCVLEFWSEQDFVRTATSSKGQFTAAVEPSSGFLETLLLMRGLLKPVSTRVYFDSEKLADDPAAKTIPHERHSTLVAKPSAKPNHFEWNVFMQGENETVFFEW